MTTHWPNPETSTQPDTRVAFAIDHDLMDLLKKVIDDSGQDLSAIMREAIETHAYLYDVLKDGGRVDITINKTESLRLGSVNNRLPF